MSVKFAKRLNTEVIRYTTSPVHVQTIMSPGFNKRMLRDDVWVCTSASFYKIN